MTRPVYTLLSFFRAREYEAISLDRLIRTSGKSRGTIQRYISQCRKHCPRGWRILTEIEVDDLGFRWTYYRFCRTAESFRKQQRLEGVA